MTALEFRTDMTFVYGEPRTLFPGVVRVVANNPGPYTFKGTNTYIVGTDTLAVIDPGPDDPDHLAALLRAIAGRPVSHVVLTHGHRDHIDLVGRFVDATGARTVGFGRVAVPSNGSDPASSETSNFGIEPDIRLNKSGARLDGDGWALEALPTPGHAPDHLCYALEQDGDATGILFSGDHVMAWNTSIVAPPTGNMADYLASLEVLIGRQDKVYLPGHGGRLENPQRMARAYLVHRRMREQAILSAIRDGHETIAAIVNLVYRGLDPRLVRAAGLSVQAHVEHLIAQKLVRADGPLSPDHPTRLAAATPPGSPAP